MEGEQEGNKRRVRNEGSQGTLGMGNKCRVSRGGDQVEGEQKEAEEWGNQRKREKGTNGRGTQANERGAEGW